MTHSIPPIVLKENKDIFAPLLTKIFNNSISKNEFLDDLKLGDIIPPPCLKRMELRMSVIRDPLQYFALSVKYLNVFYILR